MSSYSFSVTDTVGAKAKSKLVIVVIYRNSTDSPIDDNGTIVAPGQYLHLTHTLSVVSGSYSIEPLIIGGVTLQPTSYTLFYQSGMNPPLIFTGLTPASQAHFTIMGLNKHYYMVRDDLTSKPSPPEQCCEI